MSWFEPSGLRETRSQLPVVSVQEYVYGHAIKRDFFSFGSSEIKAASQHWFCMVIASSVACGIGMLFKSMNVVILLHSLVSSFQVNDSSVSQAIFNGSV